MPSVVSMPPNSSTAALEIASSSPIPSAASANSELASADLSIASRSAANPSAPEGGSLRPAVSSVTAPTMASYQASTRSTPTACNPSAGTHATGPARSRSRASAGWGSRSSSASDGASVLGDVGGDLLARDRDEVAHGQVHVTEVQAPGRGWHGRRLRRAVDLQVAG